MEIIVPGLTNGIDYQARQFVKQKDGRVNNLLKGAYAHALTTAFPAKQPLNDASWEDIDIVSRAGRAPEYWAVGDTKDIILSTDETLTLAIMGFDHDDLTDGSGKAGITFGLKNLMKDKRQINSTDTSSGGFTGSAMYTWMTGTLKPSLPADLQGVLKTVNKRTTAGNGSAVMKTNPMELFLFTEMEVFGTAPNSAVGEGTQYQYFTTEARRKKYLANGAGDADDWWERSPYVSKSNSFCSVGLVANIISASRSSPSMFNGVCFGFCV